MAPCRSHHGNHTRIELDHRSDPPGTESHNAQSNIPIRNITTRIFSKQIVETVQDRDKFGNLERTEILEQLEELYGRVLGLALCQIRGMIRNSCGGS